MIEFTTLEFVLLCWAIAATALWLDKREALKFHKTMTAHLLHQIGQGKVKIEKEGDSYMIKQV